MDRIINVKVGGNHLSKDNKNAGVRGEANVTKLRITFDEGWDNYAKTVTFWDAHGNNPVKRIQGIDLLEDITKDTRTYITPIPQEPLAFAGELTFVVDGYLDGKRQRSISDKLVVKDAPMADNAGEPTDPTPSQAEQLQGQIDKFIDDVQVAVIARDETKIYRDETEEFAKQTSEDAISAEENANKAEQSATKAEGAVGKTSYIGENGNWYTWDIEACAFYDTGIKAQSGSTVYCGDSPPDEADVWVNPNGKGISIDSKMSDTSENLVQNKVIKEYVDTTVNSKANKATTLVGYGITDAYTKEDVDRMEASMSKTINTHTTDTQKHISADERTLWNTVSKKANKSDIGDRSGLPIPDETIVDNISFVKSCIDANNEEMSNTFFDKMVNVYTQIDNIQSELEDLQTQMGNIDTALKNIIDIQNTLMGGDAV